MGIDIQKVIDATRNNLSEIKSLIFSSEIGEKLTNIAFENNLSEDAALKLMDETGYVILDLKPRSSFFASLTEAGINKDVANLLANEVEAKIFIKLDEINKNKTPTEDSTNNNQEKKPDEPRTPNGVGQSFEQIILNQAKAMQPAREAGISQQPAVSSNEEKTPENLQTEEKLEAPSNLPTEGDKNELKTPSYGGQDPYREPIE